MCCGGAEWELDLATNTGTAQSSEILSLPTIKLGGTGNPPQFFCNDTMFAQRLIADTKKNVMCCMGGYGSTKFDDLNPSTTVWMKLDASDPAARLAKAKSLFDQGIITTTEYEDKKKDIIRVL